MPTRRDVKPWRDETTLQRLYLKEELSIRQVGTKLGCSSNTICRWLDNHDIPTRSNSEGQAMARGRPSELADERWLDEEYSQKEQSSSEIAEALGCSRPTVLKALRRHNIPIRSQSKAQAIAQGRATELDDGGWLREQYTEKRRPSTGIADELGCSPVTVRRALRRHNIPVREGAEYRTNYPKLLNDQWLHEQYCEKEMSTYDIAAELDCSPSGVWLALTRTDIKTKSQGSGQRVVDELRDKEWLEREYLERGKSTIQISTELPCTAGAVHSALRRHGIQTRGLSDAMRDYAELDDEKWLRDQYVEHERSSLDIADELDCAHATVLRTLHRNQIPVREQGEAQVNLLTGEANPAWTGGKAPYGKGWTEQKREAVRDRDDRECQGCELPEDDHLEQHGQKLHVHHIKPARQFDDPEKRNAKDNLITLCRTCHLSKWEAMSPLRPDTGDSVAD